jgi:CRP-like cAMP-binding protein
MAARKIARGEPSNPPSFRSLGILHRIAKYRRSAVIFSQGDPATEVMYLQQGSVKLTVLSRSGKEAIISVLQPGDFFGEGCLAGQPLRMATAVIGTTRGRVSYFMNKFRKLGFIEYNGGITVKPALLSVVLHD